MKKFFFKVIPLIVVGIYILNLSSCVSRKEIVYFQDTEQDTIIKSNQTYNTIFRPGDIVTIVVSALDVEATQPFNMPVASFNVGDGRASGQQRYMDYLIDINGNIDFPILGKVRLGGLNRLQATNMLVRELTDYIKEPIVNIRLTNFKITVLGEVKKPGTYTVKNERITLPEAIGQAGDLTIYGKRDNVLVIREIGGEKRKYRINLTRDDLFTSPVYYLAQNDVIYVEPKEGRIKDSTFGKSTTVAFSLVSTAISLALFILRVTEK